MMNGLTLLIVDDETATREGLRAAIDFGALEKSYATLAQSATEMIGTIKESTSGLKDIMDNAEIAMEKLSAIDIEALNDGIRELNSILKPMSQFFGLFRN